MTVLAHVAGIEIPSNLVFLIMIVYLMLTCLSLSASVSRQHARIRTLVQEAALMEKRICELERRIKAGEENDDDIVAREAYKDKSR